MIKINLCPREEMENPHWWVVDAIVVVTLAFGGIFALQQYESSYQEKIEEATRQKESFDTSFAELKPDLDRAEELRKDNKNLTDLLTALQAITTSKIEKFKPVIVLEHMQTLKPEGVWYKTMEIDTANKITLTGQAFDNILIAEFAMALRATQNQDPDASDLRTQVQFSDLKLNSVSTSGKIDPNPAPGTGVPAMTGYPTFNVTLNVVEKAVIAEPLAPASAPPVEGNPPVSRQDKQIRLEPRVATSK